MATGVCVSFLLSQEASKKIAATVKATAIQRRNTHNILTSTWIFDCIDQQDLLPLEPRHIFHAIDEATAQEAEHNIDEYGDSYARGFSLESLQKVPSKPVSLAIANINQLLESMSVPVAELSLDDDPELHSFLEMEEALPGWIMKPFTIYIHSDTFKLATLSPSSIFIVADLAQHEGRGAVH